MRPVSAVRTEPLVVTRAEPRTVRIAVAGCGTVGSALLELLGERATDIAGRCGVRFDVAAVLVRDAARRRSGSLGDRVTDSMDDVVRSDTDIVVEAMGGIEPAASLAAHTLRRGAGFITANKALLARHGAALAAIARETHARLGFEAAVGGGIPIVRSLRDVLAPAGVRRIRGIMNGTTNFLINRIEAGDTAERALAEARRLGFAEADPSRDLDGLDTADKLALLAWLAFGVDPARLDAAPRGIRHHPDRLVSDARAFGGVVRLVGECEHDGERLRAVVEPVAVPDASPLAGSGAEDNIIVVETAWQGSVRIAGPGAGGRPTAAALLSDMLAPPLPPPPTHDVPMDTTPPASAWIVSVAGGPDAEHRTRAVLHDAGVRTERSASDVACARFLTTAAPHYDVELACVRLAALGLQPLMLRAELS